jgi:hypothetical protein
MTIFWVNIRITCTQKGFQLGQILWKDDDSLTLAGAVWLERVVPSNRFCGRIEKC